MVSWLAGLVWVDHIFIVSVLGQDEGYTVRYNPMPEWVPEGEARGIS